MKRIKFQKTEKKLRHSYINNIQELRTVVSEELKSLNEKHTSNNKLINAVHEKNQWPGIIQIRTQLMPGKSIFCASGRSGIPGGPFSCSECT